MASIEKEAESRHIDTMVVNRTMFRVKARFVSRWKARTESDHFPVEIKFGDKVKKRNAPVRYLRSEGEERKRAKADTSMELLRFMKA